MNDCFPGKLIYLLNANHGKYKVFVSLYIFIIMFILIVILVEMSVRSSHFHKINFTLTILHKVTERTCSQKTVGVSSPILLDTFHTYH